MGGKGPSHMHDDQHGNALCNQSTGLRLHPSNPPLFSISIKRKSCQQLMWSPTSRTSESGFQSRYGERSETYGRGTKTGGLPTEERMRIAKAPLHLHCRKRRDRVGRMMSWVREAEKMKNMKSEARWNSQSYSVQGWPLLTCRSSLRWAPRTHTHIPPHHLFLRLSDHTCELFHIRKLAYCPVFD